jgi:Family of unknown function (DUF5681)
MTADNSDDDVKVGYRKPPSHTRFKPGQSGNPRGRAKGVLNFATDLKRTLQAPITLNDRGKTRNVTTQKAVLLRLREKALKGDGRSLDRLLEYARIYDTGTTAAPSDIGCADDQAILDAFREEVLAAERANTSGSSDCGDDSECPE